MEPRGTADKPPAAQYGFPVGFQPLDAGAAVFLEVFPGTFRLRVEADGVGPDRHHMEGDIPAGHRKMLHDGDARPVHPRQAVLRHILVQHDYDNPEGELSRAEFCSGREDAAEGGIQEDHQGLDAAVVRAAVRTRSGCGTVAICTHRRPVVRGGRIPADYSVLRMPLSAARDKPQHAPGAGALGPVPQAGNSQEDSRRRPDTARNLHQHRVDALGQRADRTFLLLAQLLLLWEDVRLWLMGAA